MQSKKTELEFTEDWLPLEKCNFRILTMISVLADNHRAYRGTLKELCTELGIGNSSTNIQGIKNSLTFLENNNYIKVVKDNTRYTISLSFSAEKDKNIIKIKKEWYKLIRECNSDTSWENILKVFLLIYPINNNKPIKYTEMAKELNVSSQVISRSVRALQRIKFDDWTFVVSTVTIKDEEGSYHTIGQTFEKMITFT
ncbi:MAG: hypothetical protein J6C06_11055 [Lachnospiraceae bacterium]|nr:hypothetical protein [Lachnospiraceae bacterium]